MKLLQELLSAGVPAMAVSPKRIPLGPPYKTATGQWAIEIDGSTVFHGEGAAPPGPDQAMVDTVADVRAAHVPDPPVVRHDRGLILKLLARKALGLPISPANETLLDRFARG